MTIERNLYLNFVEFTRRNSKEKKKAGFKPISFALIGKC
jgi:hypothetical protein